MTTSDAIEFSSDTTDEDLRERLRLVERQLFDLRRVLSRDRAALPTAPLMALEIPIEQQRYLLPIDAIREVVPVVWPSELPDAPPWVRGSFRYGPLLLPMIDLRHRLLGRATALSPELTLIILQRPKWVGLLVPLPSDVILVDPDALVPPDPEIPQSPWILGSMPNHEKSGAHLLSVERLGREYVLGAS